MPNNGRITLCPYYRSEKNLSISCEDTFRQFRWPAQKRKWLDTYCDKNWKECTHAQRLNKLYERAQGGNMDKILELEHQIKTKDAELKKTSAMLGKARKREEAKDAEIRQLKRENRAMQEVYLREKKRRESLEEKVETGLADCNSLAVFCEARLAYLMDKLGGGKLDEFEAQEWIRSHNFKLAISETRPDKLTGRNVIAVWQVVAEEKGEAKDESGRLTTEIPKTGESEN